jgi:hypothetical protein
MIVSSFGFLNVKKRFANSDPIHDNCHYYYVVRDIEYYKCIELYNIISKNPITTKTDGKNISKNNLNQCVTNVKFCNKYKYQYIQNINLKKLEYLNISQMNNRKNIISCSNSLSFLGL